MIEEKKHVMLLYENAEYARLIEFRFIKNGLKNGEQCVYATEDNAETIMSKMLTYGIPLEYFKTGMLRVHQICGSCESRNEIIQKTQKNIQMIMEGLRPPFRIVSRIVPNVKTVDGISVELELEEKIHKRFEEFGGSLMCPYYLDGIESDKRKEWVKLLRENHHLVIYAPEPGHEGGVIYAR